MDNFGLLILGDLLGILVGAAAVPTLWVVVLLLRRRAKARPFNKILRQNYIWALVTAVFVSVFALIFLNNDADIPPLDTRATRVITRFFLLLAIIPAGYWLHLSYPNLLKGLQFWRRDRRNGD